MKEDGELMMRSWTMKLRDRRMIMIAIEELCVVCWMGGGWMGESSG